MVSSCLACGQPYRYFSEGELFQFRTGRGVDNFWMCKGCCLKYKPCKAEDGTVTVRLRQEPAPVSDPRVA